MTLSVHGAWRYLRQYIPLSQPVDVRQIHPQSQILLNCAESNPQNTHHVKFIRHNLTNIVTSQPLLKYLMSHSLEPDCEKVVATCSTS